MTTLAEAAVQADALAQQGSEQALADLRRAWAEELEAAARSEDFRARAVAFRAVGQFRFRQKIELLNRGLDDTSPACRGSALISLELLGPGSTEVGKRLLGALLGESVGLDCGFCERRHVCPVPVGYRSAESGRVAGPT